MPACEHCGTEAQEQDTFCGNCGKPLAPPVAPASVPTSVLIANRPAFERAAEHLDPIGSRYGAAAARQAGVFAAITTLLTLLVVVLADAGAIADKSSLIAIIWIVATLAYLVIRIPVSLSEWKMLIDGGGPQAQAVFGHVAHVLRRRRVPVDSIKVRELSQPGHPRHDYLEVRHGILTGYVTCFPYGTDLYIGWTLWWRFSPLHYALMRAGRRWQMLTVRGSELHLLYRYDVAKAMREALHAAVGEAVDAARGLTPLAPAPDDLPVETIEMPAPAWDPTSPARARA